MVAAAVGSFLIIIFDLVKYFLIGLFYFLKWFYLYFLPFIIIYIGIPLFIIGVLLALSFSAGSVLFISLFAVGMYFFVKYAILQSNPYSVASNNYEAMNASKKIFKANF